MSEIIAFLLNVISSCGNWLMEILVATDGLLIWLTACFVWAVYRFLLSPLFGYAHSDTIKKSYNAFTRRKEQ